MNPQSQQSPTSLKGDFNLVRKRPKKTIVLIAGIGTALSIASGFGYYGIFGDPETAISTGLQTLIYSLAVAGFLMFRKQKLKVSEKGVSWKTKYKAMFIPWKGIREIRVEGAILELFTQNNRYELQLSKKDADQSEHLRQLLNTNLNRARMLEEGMEGDYNLLEF